jgi:Secretion system C-terminal sorting domain
MVQKLLFTLALLFGLQINAQFTEYFESFTVNAKTFTSNGKNFTLTNRFLVSSINGAGVDSNTPANSSGSSNKYVDNIGNTAANQINSIKTTDGTFINVKELYYYVSSDASGIPLANSGSITFRGKRANITVFTITITSPPTVFPSSFTNYQGFSKLDVSTYGFQNYNIDELEIQIGGAIVYYAIDNFRWAGGDLSTTDFNKTQFEVYPNPSNDFVTLKLNSFESSMNYSLFDINGRKITSNEIKNLETQISLDNLSTGVYFLEVTSQKGKSVQKITKL